MLIGVASPSAHGQAMMSTLTAVITASAGRHEQPDHEREDRHEDHRRDEPERDRVDELLDRHARPLGLADHLNDLRQRRVAPGRGDGHREAAGRVERAAGHGVAGLLGDGHGLARDHRLVDAALAVRQLAVERHLAAGLDADHVADLQAFDGHLFLPVFRHPQRRRQREVKQLAYRPARLRPRPQLE